MADGVTTQTAALATIPTATKIATDDSGAPGHVQIVKLAISTDGSATVIPADGTYGLAVDVKRGVPGRATARLAAASSGLTTASTAYSANDQLGAIIEVTSAVATSGGFAVISGAVLLDKAAVVGAVSCYMFDRSVTVASDNAAATFSDSDMEHCLGIIEFPPPTYPSASPPNGLAQVEPLAAPIKSNATSLWCALVTRTAHTFFVAATDLRLTFLVEQ